MLVALALDAADADQTAQFDKLLGQADLDAAGVEELRTVLHDTGAVDRVESSITALAAQARAALATTTGLDRQAVAVLGSLVTTSTTRES